MQKKLLSKELTIILVLITILLITFKTYQLQEQNIFLMYKQKVMIMISMVILLDHLPNQFGWEFMLLE
jgi:uncharacterized membrane protein YjdF